MAGFRIQAIDGILTLQARQLGDGSWVQELAVEPARRTPVAPPEKLVVGVGAIVGLSPPGGATSAFVFVETQDIRYYEDGTSPTTGASGNGPILSAGGVLELDLVSFTNFKMIGKAGTATVHVLYWKYA